jgi:anti-sigma B factor antagonist
MDSFGGRLPPSELHFDHVTGADGVTRLTVTGEIDATTGEKFNQALVDALSAPGVRRVVLDLAGLRFIDSNGVALLMKAQRTADERGLMFGLVNAADTIRHVLQMLGVYEILADHPGA